MINNIRGEQPRCSDGFEDLHFYREAAQPIERRSLREETTDGVLRDQAVEVLRKWADMLSSPVEPRF